jgi:hypothetical protein
MKLVILALVAAVLCGSCGQKFKFPTLGYNGKEASVAVLESRR